MPGFERTRQAADLFAKVICCANCSAQSDQLQTLGTACKHTFCWDCINSYSKLDTFILCPRCACPLDIHHPRSAQIFNNLAHHINEFKILLDKYEQALRNEGSGAAATIAQTQALFEAHLEKDDDVTRAARNEAINDFISTQRAMCSKPQDNDRNESPSSDFSEELNDTRPPQTTTNAAEMNGKPVVEFDDCFEDFSDEEVTAAAPNDDVISDSVPQLGAPMMTSTQKPSLFFSQAIHARSDMFRMEPTQEVKTFHADSKLTNFIAKPKKTFDRRSDKLDDPPWLNLPNKSREPEFNKVVEKSLPSESNVNCGENRETVKRGPKVGVSGSACKRRSLVSTPRAHSRMSAEDPVLTAVLSGNVEEVRSAVDAGFDVNHRDETLRTPLFIAVEMGRLDICQVLVERGGAVINASCGSDCNTALHVAVSKDMEEIVKYLLSKGASKMSRNIRQETPAQMAQFRSPLRTLVDQYRTHPKQPYVARLPDVYIVCFSKDIKRSLTYNEQAALAKLMTVVEFCDEATTHYVVTSDEDGVTSVDADLLRAMMQDTRIMNLDWLKECVRAAKAVPHVGFEVSKLRYMESNVVSDSLIRCRKSKERMEPGLFHGCIFYLLSKKYKGIDDRRLLPDLVRLGGGEIAVREPEYSSDLPAPFHAPRLSSPIFVVYDVTLTKQIPSKFHHNPKQYNMVSAQWVIECVMEYIIKPIA